MYLHQNLLQRTRANHFPKAMQAKPFILANECQFAVRAMVTLPTRCHIDQMGFTIWANQDDPTREMHVHHRALNSANRFRHCRRVTSNEPCTVFDAAKADTEARLTRWDPFGALRAATPRWIRNPHRMRRCIRWVDTPNEPFHKSLKSGSPAMERCLIAFGYTSLPARLFSCSSVTSIPIFLRFETWQVENPTINFTDRTLTIRTRRQG